MELQGLAKALIETIIKTKDEELNKALDRHGLDKEQFKIKRRFPLITTIQQDKAEYYYYNNGSVNGLFLIGFELVFPLDKHEGALYEQGSHALIPEIEVIEDEPIRMNLESDHLNRSKVNIQWKELP